MTDTFISPATVGLFGTCGGSTWRDRFMATYTERGIPFYNPQVIDWKPEDAAIEAEHLVNDEIILFPVTDETYGLGSLAETGFSILAALRACEQRFLVVLIDPLPAEHLKSDMEAYKQSCRLRALVRAHLRKQQNAIPSLFVVESLDAMLDVSLMLHAVTSQLKAARAACLP